MKTTLSFDVVIIGSGLGALSVALNLPKHFKIALVTKDDFNLSASNKAQGGIAAAIDFEDSIQAHVEDTITAGAGLCNRYAVELIISQAPQAIEWLVSQGVSFDKEIRSNNIYHFHQTKEGGHSRRRVIHYKDISGQHIMQGLLRQLMNFPNIFTYSHHDMIDTQHQDNKFIATAIVNQDIQEKVYFSAEHLVIATGGLGNLYPHTTNPVIATGDGIALAFQLGCPIENLEQTQFHPTVLKLKSAPNFLISEAVRGEGGLLKRRDGSQFMQDYDERMELAPRDIVARAINKEIQRSNDDFVYLDITHFKKEKIEHHFPTIYETCLEYGLDITQEMIPIAPALHYSCGGIVTDLNGQTHIKNLYAVGEVASTGLHGANRLASNSLLECIVMGQAIAQNIRYHQNFQYQNNIPHMNYSLLKNYSLINKKDYTSINSINSNLIKDILAQTCGISRTKALLEQGIEILQDVRSHLHQNKNKLNQNDLKLNRQLTVSLILVLSALMRKESRGLHFCSDFPDKNPAPHSIWITQ
ncbi:MAG: L-aspartate oxidase [Neisseriaceae bacterium]|nr:L-aspartate oxidase [Neisseriaceae bacterium]